VIASKMGDHDKMEGKAIGHVVHWVIYEKS
jgi:hypothetical protein